MAKKFGKGAHVIDIPMGDKIGGVHKYEVEDAARTMVKHHEIKANKKLHRAAKMHIKHQKKMMERASKEK